MNPFHDFVSFRAAAERGSAREQAWLEQSVEAIRQREGDLHAFLAFDENEARQRFSAAPSGPLRGAPVAVKDNIVHPAFATTCGSRMLEGFRSPFTATALERLERAGAFLLGKTNLDEFAMGSSTEHSAFGPTRNPLDRTRVPGGSSGGSAAAVAAGMAPIALGSDTGGSVRQPAAFCGILGLKPTWGRVSRKGLVAFSSSLDQIGILARSAADAASVLSIMAGSDPGDSTSSAEPVPNYSNGLGRGVKGLKFGVLAEAKDLAQGESRVELERAVAMLRDGGANVETISIATLPRAVAIYTVVANAEASANLARFDGIRYGLRAEGATLEQVYVASRSEGLGPEVKRRIMLGTFALSSGYHDEYYGRAQRARAKMAAEFASAFERVDLLMTPTTPGPAFRLGERVDDPLSMYLSDVFTVPANLTGIPAISIPFGRTSEGLPLGLQMMGRPFAEEQILTVAKWFEERG